MLKQTGIGCAAAILLLATQVGTQEAMGQNLRNSSVRSQPIVSPYFDLLRTDSAGIPPYHMFLQRDRNVRRTFTQQESQIRYQSARVRDLERSTLNLRSQTSLMFRAATAPQQRSQAGSFMTYSHYYRTNAAR